MAKAMAEKEVSEMLSYIVEHMVTKEDLNEGLSSLRNELKSDIFSLQTHVNSIETQIREMRHGQLEIRVADLEEKVFGKSR